MPAKCEPSRWWELRGPVRVWTPHGLWPSYAAEHYHRSEILEPEVGPRVAHVLGLSSTLVPFGDDVLWLFRERPVRLGQMDLFGNAAPAPQADVFVTKGYL